jgi:signal transduction histidine kinase
MANWLRENPYFVIIDEGNKVTGIFTRRDLRNNPDALQVIDCNIQKPMVGPQQLILEAFEIMQENHLVHLPVYDGTDFLGVISLRKITARLAELLSEGNRHFHQVVHDLRTPLVNLQLLARMLKDRKRIFKIEETLDHLLSSSQHALDILDDLMYVEKSQNKPLKREATDMSRFFKQCIDGQLGFSLSKDIKIILNLSNQRMIKNIDRHELKRAIQNVIANAIKFSYPNTVIEISSRVDGLDVVLEVVDHGMGIPEALQPDVFKKFSPAGRQGTNGEFTTGLGLYFSKECIEEHGGEISFKSIEGEGTEFYIRL